MDHDIGSKEWYQSVYDLGRYAILLWWIDTLLVSILFISDLPTDFLIFKKLFAVIRCIGPCHMIPVYTMKVFITVPAQKFLQHAVLGASAFLLMLVPLFAYFACKKDYRWMGTEVLLLIADSTFIVCCCSYNRTFTFDVIFRIVCQLFWATIYIYHIHCGRMAEKPDDMDQQ